MEATQQTDSTDIFSTFATDPVKELEGAWVPLGKGNVLVARLGNRNYARLLAQRIEDNKPALERKDTTEDKKLADDLSDAIMAEVLSETILLGWDKGISYKKQAYSKEVAKQALAHADFRRRVMELAGQFETFRAAQEEAAGNV